MKKQLLLLLSLMFTGIVAAQNISIPDANFKNKLLLASSSNNIAKNAANYFIKIDTNNDGEIQESEALLVYQLNVSNSNIQSMAGVEYFTNLTHLLCNNNQISSIDVNGLQNLFHLNVSNNQLSSIDLSMLPNISIFSCNNNLFTSLDMTAVTSLETLGCSDNLLTSLNVAGMSNLEMLFCKSNQLGTLNLTGLPSLKILSCESNQLSAIGLDGLPALEALRCENNQITSLELSSLSSLQELSCGNNPISTLDLTGLSNLANVYLFNMPLEILSTSGLTSLGYINVDNVLLTELDLSESPNIDYFHITNNNVLTTVNINNGGITSYPGELEILNNPNLNFICVDEGEDLVLLEYFEIYNVTPIPLGSDCDAVVVPGEYNSIIGFVSFDWDSSGCDENDPVGSYVNLILSDGVETRSKFTNGEGNYLFYTEAGDFTLTPTFNNPLFMLVPASATIDFPDMDGSSSEQNFCLTANGIHPDAEIIVIPLGIANPGFDATYKIIYKNKGNQVLSGSLTFNYDAAVLEYVTATPAEASSSTGSLTWNYTDLMPFESRSVIVVLNVNAPTETPPVITGDTLAFSASVIAEEGDDNTDDNTFEINQTATGSYDPNNIICLEGATETPDKIGDYLHYVINFENIEQTPATFVVVTNEIDTEQYDLSTFEILNSSHLVETTVTGNVIEFRFDDINLAPDVYGNIAYKIKTKSNLIVGDEVSNDAIIVFDFNEPLSTNEATTVFAALSTGNFVKDASVTVYPNPSGNIVNIAADGNIKSYELYDVQGRLLQSAIMNETAAKLDISQRAAGMYFLKVTTTNGVKVEKIVKK